MEADMYDPTVFENLKVAIENHVYDLDNIEQQITITNRKDQMDFSILSRYFSIQFALTGQARVTAEIVLEASLQELAAEILEINGQNSGCTLQLRFYKQVQHPDEECGQIKEALLELWEDELELTQTLSFIFGEQPASYLNEIELKFKLKMTEEHMGEMGDFLFNIMKSLDVLNNIG